MLSKVFVLIFYIQVLSARQILPETKLDLNEYETFYIKNVKCLLDETYKNKTHTIGDVSIHARGFVFNHKISDKLKTINFIADTFVVQKNNVSGDFEVVSTIMRNVVSENLWDLKNNISHLVIETCINNSMQDFYTHSLMDSETLARNLNTLDIDLSTVLQKCKNDTLNLLMFSDEIDNFISGQILDAILKRTKDEFRTIRNGVIDLSDFRFQDSVFFSAVGKRGIMWDVSNFERVQPYRIENDRELKLHTLYTVLALDHATIEYDYELIYYIFVTQGKITTTLRNVTIELKAILNYSTPECSILIEYLNFNYDIINNYLTGFHIMNDFFAEEVKNKLIIMKNKMIRNINKSSKDFVQKFLQAHALCDSYKHIMFVQ